MLSSTEWDTGLAPEVGWKDAYKLVEVEARAALLRPWTFNKDEKTISTIELTEMMYPEELARGTDALRARQRIFKALAALATRGLSDCCTKGETVQKKFGPARPWLWHAPKKRKPCSHCAGTGVENEEQTNVTEE